MYCTTYSIGQQFCHLPPLPTSSNESREYSLDRVGLHYLFLSSSAKTLLQQTDIEQGRGS